MRYFFSDARLKKVVAAWGHKKRQWNLKFLSGEVSGATLLPPIREYFFNQWPCNHGWLFLAYWASKHKIHNVMCVYIIVDVCLSIEIPRYTYVQSEHKIRRVLCTSIWTRTFPTTFPHTGPRQINENDLQSIDFTQNKKKWRYFGHTDMPIVHFSRFFKINF